MLQARGIAGAGNVYLTLYLLTNICLAVQLLGIVVLMQLQHLAQQKQIQQFGFAECVSCALFQTDCFAVCNCNFERSTWQRLVQHVLQPNRLVQEHVQSEHQDLQVTPANSTHNQ